MSAIALVLCAAVAPAAHAQTAIDLSQIPLAAADLQGWSQTQALRDETWDVGASAEAPQAPSATATYQTTFTRGDETLSSHVTEASADVTAADFQQLQHNAVGQTPISLAHIGDAAFGFWESAGSTRRASAAARVGNLIVDVQVSGVTADQPVGDDQIASWLSRMATQAAAPITPFDWTQVPKAWPLLMDQSTVGTDWAQDTGLELTADELGGQTQSVSAVRAFKRLGPEYQRTLTSIATVFPSADVASADGMGGPGSAIDAPSLGDQATAFKANVPGGRDAPTVTFTINVRHGAVVLTTQETGVTWSLTSPAEVETLAGLADMRAATAQQ